MTKMVTCLRRLHAKLLTFSCSAPCCRTHMSGHLALTPRRGYRPTTAQHVQDTRDMETTFIVARFSLPLKGLVYLKRDGQETQHREDAARYSKVVAQCVLLARGGSWSMVGVRS